MILLFISKQTNEWYPRCKIQDSKSANGTKKFPKKQSFLFSPFSFLLETHTAWISITRGCQFLARSSSSSPMFLHHACGISNYSRAKGNARRWRFPLLLNWIPPIPFSPFNLAVRPAFTGNVAYVKFLRASCILDYARLVQSANRLLVAATTNAFLR